jgi:hypothetical protein
MLPASYLAIIDSTDLHIGHRQVTISGAILRAVKPLHSTMLARTCLIVLHREAPALHCTYLPDKVVDVCPVQCQVAAQVLPPVRVCLGCCHVRDAEGANQGNHGVVCEACDALDVDRAVAAQGRLPTLMNHTRSHHTSWSLPAMPNGGASSL